MTLRRGRLTRSQVAALPRITEASFQAQVVQLAKMLGWRVFHPFLSKWSERGWPDLAMARPPRLIFAEMKAERGKLTPVQDEWLELLRACGAEAYCWRPSDFDEITAVLR